MAPVRSDGVYGTIFIGWGTLGLDDSAAAIAAAAKPETNHASWRREDMKERWCTASVSLKNLAMVGKMKGTEGAGAGSTVHSEEAI